MINAGAITHVWMGERRPDPGALASFVKKVFEGTENAQIAFSPEFTICNDCSRVDGDFSMPVRFAAVVMWTGSPVLPGISPGHHPGTPERGASFGTGRGLASDDRFPGPAGRIPQDLLH